MRFSLWPHASQPWSEILATARYAETRGWDGIWIADHFMPGRGDPGGPCNECWSTLAGLAASVPRVRLGSLVSGNTYRHPAVLAKQAATVDQISGGRVVLGIGTGWQENEHAAYGITMPDASERLARLEESCQVVRSLLDNERSDFGGRYYQLADARLAPKPVQDRLPLLVGGGGERVTMRIAARHADEWNTWGTPATMAHKISVLERHCAEAGRDPVEIRRSAQVLWFSSEDQAWLERRRAEATPYPALIGTAAELAEEVAAYAAAGVNELVVPDANLGAPAAKREALDRFWEEVAGPFH